MATTEIKYERLTALKKVICNSEMEQAICAVCACMHFRSTCNFLNIGCIPNQSLLHTTDELPACVVRLSVDVDSATHSILMTGNEKSWGQKAMRKYIM